MRVGRCRRECRVRTVQDADEWVPHEQRVQHAAAAGDAGANYMAAGTAMIAGRAAPC